VFVNFATTVTQIVKENKVSVILVSTGFETVMLDSELWTSSAILA
jgi:hypothetical protein